MSAALRLVDLAMSMAPTVSPAPLTSAHPSLPPPTGPSSCRTLLPTSATRATELPSTQRSATVHPRAELAARLEAKNLIAVMRLNVDFLASLLGEGLEPCARDAVRDLHTTIDRLEHRFVSSRTP
jgi:hypothetical protein